MMKHFLIVTVLWSTVSFGQPKLEIVGDQNISFGNVYSGTMVSREMKLKNTGTEILKISELHTFCGCTHASISSMMIQPNEIATLTVGFDSKGFLGKVSKAFNINSNDASIPSKSVIFTANVYKTMVATPEFLYFGRVKLDSTTIKIVKIKNTSPATLKILHVTPTDLSVKAKIKVRSLKAGEETNLTVEVTPRSEKSLEGMIEILSDSKVQPKFSVKFGGVVVRN